MPTPDQQPTTPATPPPGHTWDGPVEDVAARLSQGSADGDVQRAAYARALGGIGALTSGCPIGATAEERLALVAHILAALDLIERRLRQGVYRSTAAEQ